MNPLFLPRYSILDPGRPLDWLVEKNIAPHIPVWDKSKRDYGTLSRTDFSFDKEHDVYICPMGKQNLRRLAKLVGRPPPTAVAGAAQTRCHIGIAHPRSQTESGSPEPKTLEELVHRSTFSYGVAQRTGGLSVFKPDGSRGLVSFAYLAAEAPEPFAAEWSSYAGGNSRSNVLHHKFVVTDFNTPHAKVFTGSSNMAAGGEKDNGDHLILIEDGRVATSYAVEALRTFDHFHFRVAMREADVQQTELKLAKLPVGGKHPWFREVYVPGHVKERDRLLFSA